MNKVPHISLLYLFGFKGDDDKAEKLLFKIIQIVHIVALVSTSVAMIVFLTILLTNDKDVDLFRAIIYLFFGLTITFCVAFGVFAGKKIRSSEVTSEFLAAAHVIQVVGFSFPSFIPLFGVIDQTPMKLIEMVPLFLVSVIALSLSYPTKKRWEKWKSK
jgi:hypothetical protein